MQVTLSGPELEEALNDTDFVFADHYVYRALLGRGAFGLVVEVISKQTLEIMAVKVLLLNADADYEQAENGQRR